MALTVSYANEAFPEDHEFYIQGIGKIKNGESIEINEEQEIAFISFNGQSIEESLKGNYGYEVSGSSTVKAEDVLPKDFSDRPSPDPTAMNLDADGNVFAEANLSGKVSEPDMEEVVEEETSSNVSTLNLPPTEQSGEGGEV